MSAAVVASVLPVLGASQARAAGPGGSRVLFGASGDLAALNTRTATSGSTRAAADFADSVPDAQLITVTSTATWAQIADAANGSPLHGQITRWADTLKARGPVMVAYQDEPELSKNRPKGSAADFIRAYQRVVTIFRERGATNVLWTWQMTEWSFRASPTARESAAKWYPGNGYVDIVGSDVYNWLSCGAGKGKWMPFSTLAAPSVAFAKARGKMVAFPEFATVTDSRRAAWIAEAGTYLKNNVGIVAAAYYRNQSSGACSWKLSTTADLTAYGSILKDTTSFVGLTTTPVPAPTPTPTVVPTPTIVPTPNPTPTVPTPSDRRVLFGAVGATSDLSSLNAKSGAAGSTHVYSDFGSSVPSAHMITVNTSASWKEVASVGPGSPLYNDIVRWATTLKSRGSVMVAYQHEPEVSKNTVKGTPADFIRAYQRVVTIFREQGASNVRWTWQMTDWAFRTAPGTRDYAPTWYPGDAYVDIVGADTYNWYTCGHGLGRWVPFSTLAAPTVAFARAHGKLASFPEFATISDPRRAAWMDEAHQYLKANAASVAAAYYFHHKPTNPANAECTWMLSSAAEFDSYGKVIKDTVTFKGL